MKKIPFPQANDLERIYRVFVGITDKGISKFDLIKLEGLTEREGAYYLDALYFLGMVDKYNTKYFLSSKGYELQLDCKKSGSRVFAEAVKEHTFFSDIYSKKNLFDTKEKYKEYIMQRIANDYSLGLVTAKRRTSTVVAWFQWIDNKLKEER